MKVQDELLQEIPPKYFMTYVQYLRDRDFRTITWVLARGFMLSLLQSTAFTTVICYHGCRYWSRQKTSKVKKDCDNVGIPAEDSQHC